MNTTTTKTGVDIRVADLSKDYTLGDGTTLHAADHASFTTTAGEFVALTGPSGSGKSTLLHLVGAIDTPDSGTITVGDAAVTDMRGNALADYRSRIGFVFQQFHLLPALSLRDNVRAPLVGRRPAFDTSARAAELLDAVGLSGRHDAVPAHLSGGQQQRVAIARALVNTPGLLLADEPTGNLDSHTAAEIMRLLATLRDAYGTTILLATHDPLVAEQADRVLHVTDGRLT